MEIKNASLGKYKILKTLGSGGTSKVKLAIDTTTGQHVAIKIIKPTYAMQRREEVERELDILSSLKHPNIVNLIDIQEDAKYIKKNGSSYHVIAIVLELVGGGDLFEYIANTGRFSEDVARTYFKALIQTLQYCHDSGIAHRDLKPENILLDDNFDLKITDFGLATLLCGKDHDYKLHTCDGTELYMAPEMHVGDDYSGAAADIFACGVILFVMISGHPPFSKADPRYDICYRCFCLNKQKIFWSQHERSKPKESGKDFYSPEFRALINGMINPDSNERFTLAQVKQHPWYNGDVVTAAKLKGEFTQRKRTVEDELEKRRLERRSDKDKTRRMTSKELSQRHFTGIKPY